VSECKGIFGWMFGHKFGAVYERIPPGHVNFKNIYFPDDQAKIIEKMTTNVFKGLYCPRCGAMTHPKEAKC